MAETRITTKGKDGQEIELVIKSPTSRDLRAANKVYSAAFRDAVESGMLVKRKLKDYLRSQNLWDDAREEEYKQLMERIGDVETKLNTGKDQDGNKIRLSDGRKLAIQLMRDRVTLRGLIAEHQEYDSNTAEGYADNERFFALVAACTYDFLTNKPYFSSLQDYKDRDSEDAAVDAANEVAKIVFGIDDNYEQTLTEYKFLKRFNMVDEEGYLVNKDGDYVDENGVVIDKPEKEETKEVEHEVFNVEEADFEDDLDVLPKEDSNDVSEVEDPPDLDAASDHDE